MQKESKKRLSPHKEFKILTAETVCLVSMYTGAVLKSKVTYIKF